MKQTALEWLSKKTFIPVHLLEQAKEMEKQQKEISDEEIRKEADREFRHFEQSKKDIWINACQWYREQLKKK